MFSGGGSGWGREIRCRVTPSMSGPKQTSISQERSCIAALVQEGSRIGRIPMSRSEASSSSGVNKEGTETSDWNRQNQCDRSRSDRILYVCVAEK